MILVLAPCSETASHYINEFNSFEEAINYIKNNCYHDLKDYKIYEAKELELTLQAKDGNDEQTR